MVNSFNTVVVDFSTDNGVGYADVFGGAINNLEDIEKIKSVRKAGVNFIRRDLYLKDILPETTLSDYKANVGNVQDPNTWDWSKYAWVDDYVNLGFKWMAIISYNKAWLSFSGDDDHGIPVDWDVYRDVVKKIYGHFKGKIHIIEIWNEPDLDLFMHLDERYTDRVTAYLDIYYHAASAIRSVDSSIPIGGPVVAHPAYTDWAGALLSDSRTKSYVDFISFHKYDTGDNPEDVTNWRNAAAQYGRPDMPVYVTEWNYDWQWINVPENNDSSDAISFIGNRLTNLLNQHVNGAHYYAFNDQSVWTDFFSVYTDGTLTPKLTTFSLLSNQLGLGLGDFIMKKVSFNGITNAGAAVNSAGDKVLWLINDGTSAKTVDLSLANLGTHRNPVAYMYEASAACDASKQELIKLSVENGSACICISMPAKSVIGFVIKDRISRRT